MIDATMTVHVITPSHVRFEFSWTEAERPGFRKMPLPTHDQVLSHLSRNKRLFGFNRTKDIKGIILEDPTSGFVYDNPETVVAIVNDAGEELTRLKGPQNVPVAT